MGRLILKDREQRLREAIEATKNRTPKGEKPPEAVVPTLLPDGKLLCPKCGRHCVTPKAWNPWNGRDEKMILVAGKCNDCPQCGCQHFVTEELALEHNHYFFPDDPQYALDGN